MSEKLTPRKVLEQEFNDYVKNWHWSPSPPKWEDVAGEHNDLGYVMNAMVRWARICVLQERLRRTDPWLPISEAPVLTSEDEPFRAIRWSVKTDEPIDVFLSELDSRWYTKVNSRWVPEEDMLPYFMYMPRKP